MSKLPKLWVAFEGEPTYENCIGIEPSEEMIESLVACHFGEEGGSGHISEYLPASEAIPKERVRELVEKLKRARQGAEDLSGVSSQAKAVAATWRLAAIELDELLK